MQIIYLSIYQFCVCVNVAGGMTNSDFLFTSCSAIARKRTTTMTLYCAFISYTVQVTCLTNVSCLMACECEAARGSKYRTVYQEW